MKLSILFVICGLCIPIFYVSRIESSSFQRVCYYAILDVLPSKLNATLCTHIIAGFSVVQNGSLDLGNSVSKKWYLQTTALKKIYTHLKVMLTVGGGGNEAGFSTAFNSTQNRTRFISSALYILKNYAFDGLDIDWEFPAWNSGAPEDKNNFISFLKEFKQAGESLPNPPLLSVAVAAPKGIIDTAYNIPQMAKYVNFINIMSYDFHDYFWYTPATGHNSPLFNRSAEQGYFATLNTAWSSLYWVAQGMPKAKIMVGLPTYGHTYKLLDSRDNGVDAPSVGIGFGGGDAAFYDVCKFLSLGATRVFDEESLVPYAYLNDDWVSYDDHASILIKSLWVKAQGFGGVMTYDLNCDDWMGVCDGKTTFPLHQIIYDVLGG